MGNNVSIVKLGSLVKIKGGKRLPKGAQLQVNKNSHPYIRVRDMGEKYIPDVGLEYVPDNVFPSIKNYVVHEGDVIISIVGTIGLVSLIDNRLHGASQTENCAKLSGLNKIDAQYLFYYLNSPVGRSEIFKGTVGAVQAKLPLYAIENMDVIWPSKKDREYTVSVLEVFDRKITLNQQSNQALEQMAQALFKSWFVDFDPVLDNALAAGKPIPDELAHRVEVRKKAHALRDFQPLPEHIRNLFPDEFEQTGESTVGIDGWVPKGWQKETLKSFGRVVTGKTPPKKIDNAFAKEGIPFITPSDVNAEVYVIDVARYLTCEGVAAVKNNVIDKGSVCVTCIGSQMGKTIIATDKSVTNQQLNSIVFENLEFRNYVFLNLRLRRQELFDLGSGGSTMPILNKSAFENLSILRPCDATLSLFRRMSDGFLSKLFFNMEQINNLSALRDRLLPKLISGEIQLDSSGISSINQEAELQGV